MRTFLKWLKWSAMRLHFVQRMPATQCPYVAEPGEVIFVMPLGVWIFAAWPSGPKNWLNFMLSQKNLWPTFTTLSTFTEELTVQAFSKEKRRLQAEHLWMNIHLRWKVLSDGMYVQASTGKPKEYLNTLLFNQAT